MGLEPVDIIGFQSGGLVNNSKPFLIMNEAFQMLYNAYTWRDRVKNREGLKFLGRLSRILVSQSLGNTPGGPPNTVTFNDIFTTIGGFSSENPELQPGSITITVGAPDNATFTDNGSGGFVVTGAGVSAGSYVNYATGKVVLQFSALTGGGAITINFTYYPSLPVMGIIQREIPGINTEQTVFFDQIYAYDWTGTGFAEFIPGTIWSGGNADFFWGYNYRGVTDDIRLLFVTNFVVNASNPIRYTDGSTWTTFAPLVSATNTLFQARIIVAYYGRLLMFNTWEGATAAGYGSATNNFNRCRFSAIGDPTAVNAWRSDIFGQGGFIDAPTNEEIISAAFIKNSLIVWFEQSTWQLRYVGEYGLPFIWERISSDFGSECTFSTVIFDAGSLTIGDKAIISSNANGVQRVDVQIPDQVFDVQNGNSGVERVQGIRNYQKELVYWCYSDAQLDRVFPNRVLVYNYQNNTWAIFRDNITAFGNFFLTGNAVVLWDSTDVFWGDSDVYWNDIETIPNFPAIVSGNQQGYIHQYADSFPDEQSLSITGIDLTKNPIQIIVKNHNLENGDFIYINGIEFINTSISAIIPTNLNGIVYKVQRLTPGSAGESDIVQLLKWNGTEYVYLNYVNFPSLLPVSSGSTYIGGGNIALLPQLNVITKDFNPYLNQGGGQVKVSYIDFLMGTTETSSMSIILYANTSPSVMGNLGIGNTTVETSLTPPFYVPASDIAWHRFYATLAAQFFSIQMTYSDAQMQDITTQEQIWELNAFRLWVQRGSRLIF